MLRNIIILAVVFVGVLVAAVIGIKTLSDNIVEQQRQQEERQNQSSVTPEFLKLSAREKGDVAGMKVTIKSGEVIEFEKNPENLWTIKGLAREELDPIRIDDIMTFGARVVAEAIIVDDTSGLEQNVIDAYGFKEPNARVEAAYADGVSKTYLLGNKVPGESTYYLMVEGDNKIYSVWSNYYTYYTRNLPNYMVQPKTNLTTDKINHIVVEIRGKYMIEMDRDSVSSYGINYWQMTSPYSKAADQEKAAEYVKKFNATNFAAVATVNVAPTAADIKAYGLEEPMYVIHATDTEGAVLDCAIGNFTEESTDYRYCRFGGDTVYTINNYNLDFLGTTAMNLLSTMIEEVTIHSVKAFEVESLRGSIRVDVEQYVVKNADGTDKSYSNGSPQYDQRFYVDGIQTPDIATRVFFQNCIGIYLDGVAKEPVTSTTPDCTITYTTVDDQKIVLQFIPYDFDRYVVYRNGSGSFTCKKEEINEMLDALDNFISQIG